MGETTVNAAYMYDEVEEIRNLNKVEGFDPRRYMRIIGQEGQAGKYYLDVAFRKLWFRLKYPEGKIVKKILKLTDQVAIVEARIYLHRNDSEENFIANALAQKYRTEDGQFGNKFVELAETAAVGRALSDAGFGLQFADKEEDIDPEVTEAPFEPQFLSGSGIDGEVLGEMLSGENMESGAALLDENIPGQYGIENYIPMPEEVGQAMGMTPAMSQNGNMAQQNRQSQPQQNQQQRNGAQQSQPRQNQQQSNQPQPKPVQAPAAKTAPQPGRQAASNAPAGKNTQGAANIKKDMPVEQIYSMLDRDSAAAVVIPMGYNKGKTLGQVAVEKPANLQWYVDSYGGPDNLLRAAAKFLIDMALGQAS
ncbi:MAG: hypothetical protein K1W35_09140 [Lachnospiraceae bacterium]